MKEQSESCHDQSVADLKGSSGPAGRRNGARFSLLTTVVAASVLTIVLLMGWGWQARQSYLDHKGTQKQVFPIGRLRGRIIHFDEVLTMSANMAAATGEAQWEKRYRQFEPQLDVAIKSLERLVPETFDSAAAIQTDEANIKLVEMENQVFELVGQGRLDEAQAILSGDDYRKQKKLYSDGMERIAADLDDHIAANLERHRKRALVAIVSVLLGLPLLALIWLWVLQNMRRHLKERDQAERALRESEERFRSLVGNIPGTVYRCEIPYPWQVEHISEAVFEISGYHAEDLIEGRIQGIGEFIVPEDVEDAKRLVTEGVAAHRPFELKYRIRHVLGGFRWVHERGQAIYDADGKPLWLDGIILDITEGKKVEEDLKKAYDKLERSEQQFRSVAEKATSAIISADKNGNIVFWNNAAEKTFGYSAEEILNKPLTTIMPQRYHKAHLKGFNHLIETGKSRIRDWAVELFGLKKNGSEFPLELFLSKWKVEGDIFFTGIINDTTGRKQAEERLKDSEKRSRAWLENSPVCTKILDLDFNLQYMSRAGIDGLKIDDITEFYGKPFPLSFYPDSARDSMTKCLEKVMETGEIVTGETPLFDLEGNEVWYYATFVPVKNDEGQIEYIIIVSVDTTERKRAEQERERLLKTLAAKNEELQSIVYVASHDLKSPLVNIQGFSGELSRTCEQIDEVLRGAEVPAEIQKQLAPLLDEDIPESIRFIRAGTVKMQALLDGLLEVCRVGNAVLQIKALDMNKMIKHIIATMQYQITDSGAELTADDLPGCIGDGDHVNQVFSNLLANAVKYLDPDRKGRIHISGRAEAGESIYCVQDNGMGIAPQHQEKVFEIFHRLDPDRYEEGEGLGLTIALRILERHEGRIWVESEPGKGSRFFVSLPTA